MVVFKMTEKLRNKDHTEEESKNCSYCKETQEAISLGEYRE